jgi:hypothetical protein
MSCPLEPTFSLQPSAHATADPRPTPPAIHTTFRAEKNGPRLLKAQPRSSF